MSTALAVAGAVLWAIIWALPWRPWRAAPRLEANPSDLAGEAATSIAPGASGTAATVSFDDLEVLIPARNEAELIGRTLDALLAQGRGLKVLVVDDESTDDTAAMALARGDRGVSVLRGSRPPPGWSGKVWALAQGQAELTRPYVLLLDADVVLAPGILAALRAHLYADGAAGGLVSLMVELPHRSVIERLLMPAFIYYFKLLYPFALANDPASRCAAGGCVLVRRRVLTELGGFASLHDALIDDCALAARTKAAGHRTWIGLTRSARSTRDPGGLKGIWRMVARCAFTQLGYRTSALLACSGLMVLAYSAPVLVVFADGWARGLAGLTWLATAAHIVPTLRFYGVSKWYATALPLAGALYLAMTWSAAIGFWRGRRSSWKARDYAA